MGKSRGPELAVLGGIALAICCITVGLRVYVRTVLSKSFGLDDWYLLIALAFFTTYIAVGFSALRHGVGRKPEDIPKADLAPAFYYWWLCSLFYTLATLFVRLSISVFLTKLSVNKVHKIIIWSTMGIVIAYSTFYFFLTMFQCSPYTFFWQRFNGVTEGNCIDHNAIPAATYTQSVISAIADWILGLLPISMVWGLQMNKRTKISVGILLGLGVIAGIAAIIRIPYVRILVVNDAFLYAVVDVSLWSLIESALGIIAAAASALRPLFKRFYQITTNYGASSKQGQSQANRYAPHGAYIRNASSARDRMDDDYGLERGLGFGSQTRAVGGIEMLGMDKTGAESSRSGSEENLTKGGEMGDIYVQTTVEINSMTGTLKAPK